MVAEYGINVDKRDNSEVGARTFASEYTFEWPFNFELILYAGVSNKVLNRIASDAVEIGQVNAEMKKYVHSLNSNLKKIQNGIKPFQLSFFGGKIQNDIYSVGCMLNMLIFLNHSQNR